MSIPEIPVTISVKTMISHQEHTETVDTTTTGYFYHKDNALFLKYEETSETVSVRTIVKVAANDALVLRNGAVKMRLPFVLGVEKKGHYETPFGTFETATMTKQIEHDYQAESGKGQIRLVYDFSLQGSNAGTYELHIHFWR